MGIGDWAQSHVKTKKKITDLNKLNESPIKYFISLENRARYKLIKRYNKPLSYHDVEIINDILYNEKNPLCRRV